MHINTYLIQRQTKKEPKGSFVFGGGEGNRTPVRKPLDATFSGCRESTEFPKSTADSQAVIPVAF